MRGFYRRAIIRFLSGAYERCSNRRCNFETAELLGYLDWPPRHCLRRLFISDHGDAYWQIGPGHDGGIDSEAKFGATQNRLIHAVDNLTNVALMQR